MRKGKIESKASNYYSLTYLERNESEILLRLKIRSKSKMIMLSSKKYQKLKLKKVNDVIIVCVY